MKKPKFFSPSSGHQRSPSYSRPPIRTPKRKATITSYTMMTDAELAKLDEVLSADNELLKSALENTADDLVDDRDGAGVAAYNSKFVGKVIEKLAAPLSAAIEFEVGKRLGAIERACNDALEPKQPTVSATFAPAKFKVKRRDPLKGRTKSAAQTVKNEIIRDEHGRPEHILEHHPDGRTVRRTIVRDERGLMVGTTDETYEPEPTSPTLKRARAKP